MSSLGDLDPLEPEGAHRADQDYGAGEDRRRPVGVQAPDPSALGERQRGEAGELALQLSSSSTWPSTKLGVVGIEVELDRRQRGRRAGDSYRAAGGGAVVAAARRVELRADRIGERLELLASGGSELRKRSLWRTTPSCSDSWKSTPVVPRR